MPPSPRLDRAAGVLAITLVACACTADDGDNLPSCVELDLAGCSLAYEPTFDNVYQRTIANSCALGGSSCHASSDASGAQGGLVMSSADATFENLLDLGLVVPGNARCSTLTTRLEIDDADLRMPPGNVALDERERCSIAHWIEEGANR